MFFPLFSKQVHLLSRSRDGSAGGGSGTSQGRVSAQHLAGQAAMPDRGHGETPRTSERVPRGKMLQRQLGLLKRTISSKENPTLGTSPDTGAVQPSRRVVPQKRRTPGDDRLGVVAASSHSTPTGKPARGEGISDQPE